jgi:hypothetical protein
MLEIQIDDNIPAIKVGGASPIARLAACAGRKMKKKKTLIKPALPIGELPGLLNQKAGPFRKDKTVYKRRPKHKDRGGTETAT